MLLAASGCTSVERCKTGTLFVSLTLAGATAAADSLEVTVSISGGGMMITPLSHKAGVTKGGVEVQFPSGYPDGQSITVDVTAKQNGLVVGSGGNSVTLGHGCGALSIAVMPSQAALDLAGADFSGVDFSGVDLAGADFAIPPDFSMAPPMDLNGVDLTCVPLSANEDCFNGIDDNCDGLVDCADPQCTATTTCVPVAAGAAYGTILPSNAPCPQPSASTQQLYGAFSPGYCTGCNSGYAGGTPVLVVRQFAAGCNGTILANVTATDCSASINSPGAITEQISGITCAVPTGTPTLNPGSYTQEEYCTSTTVGGGGCAPGNTCVPKVGSNQVCVMVDSTASCPAGYSSNVTPSFGTWYTGKDTSQACDVCANAMLEPTAEVFFCSSASCGCGGTYIGNCPSTTLNALFYLGIQNPGCNANAVTTGNYAGAGAQKKVCCQ
jgi:hypothetical protein